MSLNRTLLSFGAGAAVMYLFDPDRGRRRRALFRDKLASGFSQSGRGLDKAVRDAANRSHGAIAAGARSLATRRGGADDEVLVARVRTRLGRIASHPHAIRVTARDGVVTLEGPILASERARVAARVRAVPGILQLVDRMESHEDAADIPSLQGGASRSEAARNGWTPSWRAAASLAGGWLMATGLRRHGILGTVSVLAGTGLMTRAAANMPLGSLVGAGEPCSVNVQKAINVHASVEEVYAFWKKYENFPRVMTHVKEVRDLGGGRSEWIAVGPGGAPVSWQAEITEDVPNRSLAWRSARGSRIENAGSVRFDPNSDGGTRITVRMSYSPPAGMLGHAVASLFRRDPRHELDDDFARLKSLIDYGKTRAHGATVHREDVF